MNYENFDRMDSLVSIQATKSMVNAMRSIAQTLLEEGFDDNDIAGYLSRISELVVDDVLFEMNEWPKK